MESEERLLTDRQKKFVANAICRIRERLNSIETVFENNPRHAMDITRKIVVDAKGLRSVLESGVKKTA